MRLIGLHARLHAGKDTAYEVIDTLASERGELAVRRAFADPLKRSGMRALGFHQEWPDEALVDLANAIKETGRIVVTYDGVSESGNVIPKAQVITGRQLWQFYGTEAHRADDLGSSFGTNFWVDNLLPVGTTSIPISRAANGEADKLQPKFWDNFKEGWAGFADYAVVTDVRFPNEAERVLKLGGEVWRIDADGRLGPNEDAHASEQPLPANLVTRVIDNNGSLADFEVNVAEAFLADD